MRHTWLTPFFMFCHTDTTMRNHTQTSQCGITCSLVACSPAEQLCGVFSPALGARGVIPAALRRLLKTLRFNNVDECLAEIQYEILTVALEAWDRRCFQLFGVRDF